MDDNCARRVVAVIRSSAVIGILGLVAVLGVSACGRPNDGGTAQGEKGREDGTIGLPAKARFSGPDDQLVYELTRSDVDRLNRILQGQRWRALGAPLILGEPPRGVREIAWSDKGVTNLLLPTTKLTWIVEYDNRREVFECSDVLVADALGEELLLYHVRAYPRSTSNFRSWRKGDREVVAIVEQFPNLVELDLSGDEEVTDRALVNLTRLSGLVSVNLDLCTKLSASSLEYLAKIPSLRTIVLTRVSSVSKQDVEKFKAARPDCEVSR